jgi:hypothetical protein
MPDECRIPDDGFVQFLPGSIPTCILAAKPDQMNSIRIRCPKCEWEPDGKPYWRCSCGHRWDTFSTGGRCFDTNRNDGAANYPIVLWDHEQPHKYVDFAPDFYQLLIRLDEEIDLGNIDFIESCLSELHR